MSPFGSFATVRGAALAWCSAGALAIAAPRAIAAQAGAPDASQASEPVLERRSVTGSAARPAPGAIASEPDPWISSYIGIGGRVARLNLAQLDRALEPYRATYARLEPGERARIRQAFDDLMPGQRFTRYSINEPQARGMVYLALGPVRWRDCDGPSRRGGRTRCDAAIDSMTRGAAWTRATIFSLGQGGPRRPHAEELAAVRRMNEEAGAMVLSASTCGCPAARAESDALLAGTRDAVSLIERSVAPAWVSLGDQRIDRIARLSASLERTFARCANEG